MECFVGECVEWDVGEWVYVDVGVVGFVVVYLWLVVEFVVVDLGVMGDFDGVVVGVDCWYR